MRELNVSISSPKIRRFSRMESISDVFGFKSSSDDPHRVPVKRSTGIDWITSAQLSLGSDEIVLTELLKALFEDFYTNCNSLLQSPEDLIRCFRKLLDDAISSLRQISTRTSSEKSLLNSTLAQLISEQKAYSLLCKITDSETSISQLERGRSVLWDLLLDDLEFRRLLILLDWCEENAFNEPSANSELTEEYSQLENGAHIRAETLYRRKKGEEWCDMDLDGAMHGRLHPIDEDRQNRVYNLVYTLIRCGKLSEAIKLLDHVGLLALIPSFKFREMARDASLTPLSCDHRLFRLANSRLSFKQTVEKIIHRGLSMSQIERCIWSAVGGLLEPGLSLSQRTDDRLWCYLNTAIENRLDIAIMKHHPDLCDEDSLQQKTSDLMVTSIFDEIATQERSPFYSSYRFLITNDAESHVTFMRQWLETHLHERHNVHFLRYITHLVIVYMSTNQPFAEEDAYWILERYIDVLVSQKMYTIIPYYASKLPSEAAERLTIGFMYEIEDEKMRIDVLASCHEVGVDTTTLCKKVFSYAVDVCQIGEQRSESDAKLISAWNWLKYPGKEAVIDALFAANLILRKFFAVEKVKEAKLVFDQMEENLSETIEKLWSIEYRDGSMPKELSDAIAENRAYQAYIEASDDFNNWFKQLKMTQPETPKSPTKEVWSRMNIHQRAAFEVEQAKVRELQQRHRATCDSLRSTAIDSLESLSLWPNGWLKFAPLDETLRNNADLRKKMEELREIRQSYVSAILGMLITIYDQSQDSSGAIRLAMLLADEKNEIAEALSRDQLCSFVRRLSVAHGGINQ